MLPVRTLEQMEPKSAMMKGVAQELGLTYYAVRKIARAYEAGGEKAVEQLNWIRGHPLKNSFFTQTEIDQMVSRVTLNKQLGMSLRARAQELSVRFRKPLKVW